MIDLGKFKGLTKREKTILTEMCEFDKSYVELAKKYKVTKERIRQIEHQALKKLKK